MNATLDPLQPIYIDDFTRIDHPAAGNNILSYEVVFSQPLNDLNANAIDIEPFRDDVISTASVSSIMKINANTYKINVQTEGESVTVGIFSGSLVSSGPGGEFITENSVFAPPAATGSSLDSVLLVNGDRLVVGFRYDTSMPHGFGAVLQEYSASGAALGKPENLSPPNSSHDYNPSSAVAASSSNYAVASVNVPLDEFYFKITNISDHTTTSGYYGGLGLFADDTLLINAMTADSVGDYTVSYYGHAYEDPATGYFTFNSNGKVIHAYEQAYDSVYGSVYQENTYYDDGTLKELYLDDETGLPTSFIKKDTYYANGIQESAYYFNTGNPYLGIAPINDLKLFDTTGFLYHETSIDGGVRDEIQYGMKNLSYDQQNSYYDSNNVLASIQRTEKGNVVFLLTVNADGSQAVDNWSPAGVETITNYDNHGVFESTDTFDAAGRKTADVTRVDGVNDSKSFDPLTGKVLSESFHYSDGSRTEIDYAVTGKAYAEQSATYDKSGTLRDMTRTYANGISAFTQIMNDEGSGQVLNFDLTGRITTSIAFASDGSRDVVTRTYSSSSAVPSSVENVRYGANNQKLSDDTALPNHAHAQIAYQRDVTLTSTTAIQDTFTSSAAGSDTFVFAPAFGQDLVTNFHAGTAPNHDTIQFDSSIVPDFAHLQSMLSQSGHDTLITVTPSDTLLVKGVASSALVAQDFQFVSHQSHLV